jgi:hypothetical protein
MRKRKQPRVYTAVTRRFYHPEITICPTCQTPLRRYATLSQRTVITLEGPVRLIHRGYRCPNVDCTTHLRSYRSARLMRWRCPGLPLV